MRKNVQILGAMLGASGAIGLYFASILYAPSPSLVVLSSGLFLVGSMMVAAAKKIRQ